MKKTKQILFIAFMFITCFIQAQTIKNVTSLEFYEQLDSLNNSESMIIIDSRNNRKYSEGHISGAINIDAFSDDMQTQLMEYISTKIIVVYCKENTRSETIIKALNENKFAGIIIDITDGFTGWTENNLPVEE